MKLALAQLLVEGTEPERNFERAEKLIARAASAACQLTLLPETIDFAWTHPDGIRHAKPIPGEYSDHFCLLAKKYNMWICVGLTEKTSHGNYNTAVLIDNNGNLVGLHRKINLLTVEFPYYLVGQKLEVYDTPFGKIGMNICADNYLDALDIGHVLARMGAQLILSPSSWTVNHSVTEAEDPYRDKWIKPFSVLARAHGLVIASATSVGYIVGGPYEGKKMVGCSLCVGPQGIIAQGMFNEFAGDLAIAEFDMPQRPLKGTQIGEALRSQGFKFYN
ncbi:MAG: carbon-nitrogen hydrolase family protein [Chitinophagales bacterium]|nr:carbon-nitrogen hydrolase family protein [Chitinophagales bacterium]MDW8417815.1 carbon-nitrogen hydrolase family protein [Chitinophagales bacterium]